MGSLKRKKKIKGFHGKSKTLYVLSSKWPRCIADIQAFGIGGAPNGTIYRFWVAVTGTVLLQSPDKAGEVTASLNRVP